MIDQKSVNIGFSKKIIPNLWKRECNNKDYTYTHVKQFTINSNLLDFTCTDSLTQFLVASKIKNFKIVIIENTLLYDL